MQQTAGMSGAGYERIIELDKTERMKMADQARYDLIGVLHSLPDYLNPEARKESRDEKRIFDILNNYLDTGNYPYESKNRICELANEYGIAAEESGFRQGFRTAMRLCMEGLGAS